ncbi:4490_t:CDS:2 [Dentiscutata erythropus]|uniref:4490_t:CDS:1 n=1 Tax=Dentiscutata erythropus TaxID=1348616 RepID=A0A9N9EGE9_9GLOM|nr:4490_t:CDS:2 [Dentiscutata erythropus]
MHPDPKKRPKAVDVVHKLVKLQETFLKEELLECVIMYNVLYFSSLNYSNSMYTSKFINTQEINESVEKKLLVLKGKIRYLSEMFPHAVPSPQAQSMCQPF